MTIESRKPIDRTIIIVSCKRCEFRAHSREELIDHYIMNHPGTKICPKCLRIINGNNVTTCRHCNVGLSNNRHSRKTMTGNKYNNNYHIKKQEEREKKQKDVILKEIAVKLEFIEFRLKK